MAINQKKWGATLSYVSLISNVLVKFIYTPLLLRMLGQAEYGLYSLVISIVGYLAILDFGFGTTVTRYTVKYITESDRKGMLHLYGTLSIIYIIIGLLAFLICFGISLGAESLFGASMTPIEVDRLKLMIILCGINLLFMFPLQISSSVLIAYEKFVFKNGVQLLISLLEPLIMILLLYFVHIKSVGAVVVVTFFNLLRSFLFYLYAVKKLDYHFALNYFDKDFVKTLLSFSLGMFLLMLFEQLQFNSGQFILGMCEGTEIVAVWGVTIVFVMNYRSLSTAITNVYMPSFLSLSFNKDWFGINIVSERIMRLQCFVLVPIILNYILFGYQFITIWAGPDYQDAYLAALIVMIPMTISLLLDFSYLYQMAIKHMTYRIITLYGGFIFAFLVILLYWGISILSFACIMCLSIVIGQILFAIIYIVKYMKVEYIRFLLSILKIVSPLMLFSALYYIYIRPSIQNLVSSNIMQFITEVIVYNLILLFVIRFISMNEQEKKMIKINLIK